MSIKSYSFDDTTQLTKDFNVSEFKCKCGKSHKTYISEELVQKLQYMKDLVKADYVLISSGYRCSTHDRNVGGYGSGPHVDGYAADCTFIKDNKPINTKLLSCVAQDLGFMGIANITSDYSYIHLDMKGRVYKGNEIINYNTLTNDFYSYYGITKEEINELIGTNLPNENTSSTSSTNKVNNKDTKKNIIWSNKYDPKIKELQQILTDKGFNLIIDGYAGPNTYAVVKKFTIEKNDRGPLVRWVQERLVDIGYSNCIADGIAGNITMNLIKKFQSDNNLGQGYLGGTDWVYLLGGTIK